MDVFDAVKARKSVRAYEPTPIPEDVLLRILESARLSPSAMNRQPWHFVVVMDAAKRKSLSEGAWAKFLKESPVVIAGCADREESPEWSVVDATIAMQTVVLAATGEGIGTCWVGSFDEAKVKALLKIPEKYEVVALLAMGYAREKLDLARALVGKKRKSLADIASFDEFGKAKR